MTLYERVDRDGNGEDVYLDAENAWRETERSEKVAEAVYTLSGRPRLVRPGGTKNE
ncbi:MAG: hypothetical protein OXG04_10420 [Acidobacteria bacterium]|nr:hypothetical protein [Acidobacteriota bacterium]